MKNDDQTAKLMFQNFAFNIYDFKKNPFLNDNEIIFFFAIPHKP